MVTAPVLTPLAVTSPDALPIVAINVLLLFHVPPIVASLSVVVKLAHTLTAPMIGVITPTTFTVAVLVQPEASVYVTEVLPTLTPVTIPVDRSIVAIAVLLLLHVPPVVASDKVVCVPVHTFIFPVIGKAAFTVTETVALHPPVLGK